VRTGQDLIEATRAYAAESAARSWCACSPPRRC
jgi:hypothetical protein